MFQSEGFPYELRPTWSCLGRGTCCVHGYRRTHICRTTVPEKGVLEVSGGIPLARRTDEPLPDSNGGDALVHGCAYGPLRETLQRRVGSSRGREFRSIDWVICRWRVCAAQLCQSQHWLKAHHIFGDRIFHRMVCSWNRDRTAVQACSLALMLIFR